MERFLQRNTQLENETHGLCPFALSATKPMIWNKTPCFLRKGFVKRENHTPPPNY